MKSNIAIIGDRFASPSMFGAAIRAERGEDLAIRAQDSRRQHADPHDTKRQGVPA